MNAREALEIIFKQIKNEPVVHATGYLCRISQAIKNRPQNFYMIGSMGMASSIALGVALHKPQKKVITLDGDGAVLMNLGTLPMVGALKPSNFLHIVIDNESYESTGDQPTYTRTIRLEKIAKSSGYKNAQRVTNASQLKNSLTRFLKIKGPSFLLVKVEAGIGTPPPRIAAPPEEITKSFSESLV